MIFLYTGKTGSGKTFQMIKDVYPRWKRGEDIYSNTKLFYEDFGGRANTNLIDDPDDYGRIDHIVFSLKRNLFRLLSVAFAYFDDCYVPSRGKITYFDDITELLEVQDGVIIMDEAQNLLDARNWENLPLEFSNKLRQHRKHNLDLYATTQNMGTIDINMRRLVQKWTHCKDVFALFWIRNPSLFTLHQAQQKDIDELYNKVDDLVVTTIKSKLFIIHRWKKKYYDTLWDIGFKAYKQVWIEMQQRKIALIMPKNWTLSQGRTQLLLQKFYLDQNKSSPFVKTWKN